MIGGAYGEPITPMHDIHMHHPQAAFGECYVAAGKHLEKLGGEGLRWIKADLSPPFLEHLSFRIGNQVFFVRLEDSDRRNEFPSTREGLLIIADGWRGHACVMPMQQSLAGWTPVLPGWGLFELASGRTIDPYALVTAEPVEMTAWELQDLAVQIVRDHLSNAGREIMSSQGNPEVEPALWFVGYRGPEFVVVRAARYPARVAPRPVNWQRIEDSCASVSRTGHFASVAIAGASQVFQQGAPTVPLFRGRPFHIAFAGLQAV
jgi:hypothetical protein